MRCKDVGSQNVSASRFNELMDEKRAPILDGPEPRKLSVLAALGPLFGGPARREPEVPYEDATSTEPK